MGGVFRERGPPCAAERVCVVSAAAEVQREALGRAVQGQSAANYSAIFEGFMARGIPEAEIRPRENVFTFEAWRALRRHVRRGEHGVRVTTWIPVPERLSASGEVERPAGKRCKVAFVFHVSQTDADGAS